MVAFAGASMPPYFTEVCSCGESLYCRLGPIAPKVFAPWTAPYAPSLAPTHSTGTIEGRTYRTHRVPNLCEEHNSTAYFLWVTLGRESCVTFSRYLRE